MNFGMEHPFMLATAQVQMGMCSVVLLVWKIRMTIKTVILTGIHWLLMVGLYPALIPSDQARMS